MKDVNKCTLCKMMALCFIHCTEIVHPEWYFAYRDWLNSAEVCRCF
eukprot:UN27985